LQIDRLTDFVMSILSNPDRSSRPNGRVERRHADRRSAWRGGRRATDVVRAAVAASLLALSSAAFAQPAMQFGFDLKSVARARELGIPVGYGSTWAGAWIQKFGWNGIADDLKTANATGAVPVVQWWYWGDDISPGCVEGGCQDRYHGVRKDRATWSRMSNELADLIVRVGGPEPKALVVIENEFNKNGIESYEPFDGYLVEQAAIFHRRGIKVIIGFGNWGQPHWKNFDRAIAAADLLGTMRLQSSLRDASTYLSSADELIGAAKYFHTVFGKPTFVTDFAFSSYPEPSYEGYQDMVVRDIFRRIDELSAAGVQGMIWRMLLDDPAFDTNNYHGVAERHWGLLRADGRPKAAFETFRSSVANTAVPSVVRAVHVVELRTRIDALRVRLGLVAFNWHDAALAAGGPIKAQHFLDLRTAVAETYAAARLPPPTFTDAVLAAGQTIKSVHIMELRTAVSSIERA
jgi:hypothetical protein